MTKDTPTPTARPCVSHHHACDCRERQFTRMEAALTRLQNCDWTITPLDRMDAVRDIARAALNGEDTRPHD